MRITTLLALIAGAFLLTSATPEPVYAFEFCTGLKPIEATARLKLGCENLCARCRDFSSGIDCGARDRTDRDSDRDGERDRDAERSDCRWVWVCC